MVDTGSQQAAGPDEPPARCFIGTSGWVYDDWQGRFYPNDLPAAQRFAYYATQFPTVELNATFYRLFPERTFQSWARKAPPGFVYAVKLWRRITHHKRLQDVADDVAVFMDRALVLADHLGPILVQLPPTFAYEYNRLVALGNAFEMVATNLDCDLRIAVEFRHPSWFCDKTYRLLNDLGWALCIADLPRLNCPRWVTGPFVYLRFHGMPQLYRSLYGRKKLAEWAAWIRGQCAVGRDVYTYFNNDYQAHAVTDARMLTDMVR